MTALTTPDQIAHFRMLTLRAALKLEIAGMKRRGRSAYSILKAEGFTGTRAAVLQQLNAQLDTPTTMAELEAESPDGFRNPTRTAAEQAEMERRTKAMREYDRTHTARETNQPEED